MLSAWPGLGCLCQPRLHALDKVATCLKNSVKAVKSRLGGGSGSGISEILSKKHSTRLAGGFSRYKHSSLEPSFMTWGEFLGLIPEPMLEQGANYTS